MYQEIEVYEPTYFSDNAIYLCRGMAVTRVWPINKTYWPNESRLLLTKEQKKQLEHAIKEGVSKTIYRYTVLKKCGEKRVTSSWFMAEEDAMNCPLAKEYSNGSRDSEGEWISAFVDHKVLNTESIEPAKFPMVVDLVADNDGRLSCRINLHPELDGYNANGMVCFPDRSMVGAYAGKALITGVKEKGTYGFLMGGMVQYGMPDMDKFLDYVWARLGDEMDKEFLTVNHPGLGRFLYSDGYAWVETATSPYCKDDSGYWPSDYAKVSVPFDVEQYVEERATLEDIFLMDAFGTALTKQDILDRFPHYKFFDVKYNEFWQRSDRLMPEIIEQAVTEGFLNLVCLSDSRVLALEVDESALYRLSSFSIEEIEEMARQYAQINDEAEQAIKARIKKGTLRLQNIA